MLLKCLQLVKMNMERRILVLMLTISLDRGRKYGISFGHELAHFLFVSTDKDRGIGTKIEM